MEPLKLIALDEEDLAVVSSLLQDAVLRVADMTYVPAQKRFAAVLNRFDWEKAVKDNDKDKGFRRRRSALRFDRVFAAQLKNIKPRANDRVLSLLAVSFEPMEPPCGPRDALLSRATPPSSSKSNASRPSSRDLGPAWRTRSKPKHPGDEPGAGREPRVGRESGAGKS